MITIRDILTAVCTVALAVLLPFLVLILIDKEDE